MNDVFRNNNRLKDEDIAYAAGLVCQTMIASLPDPEEYKFAFSERFEHKMETLIKTQKRQAVHKAFVKWVLTVLLSILVSTGVWLTVELWKDSVGLSNWIAEGISRVESDESCQVLSGSTYIMTVNGSIDGVAFDEVSITKKCNYEK